MVEEVTSSSASRAALTSIVDALILALLLFLAPFLVEANAPAEASQTGLRAAIFLLTLLATALLSTQSCAARCSRSEVTSSARRPVVVLPSRSSRKGENVASLSFLLVVSALSAVFSCLKMLCRTCSSSTEAAGQAGCCSRARSSVTRQPAKLR